MPKDQWRSTRDRNAARRSTKQFTGKPRIADASRFSFGKYANRQIAEIVREDPAYIGWLIRQDWLDQTVKDAITNCMTAPRTQRGKRRQSKKKSITKLYPFTVKDYQPEMMMCPECRAEFTSRELIRVRQSGIKCPKCDRANLWIKRALLEKESSVNA